MGKTKGEDKRSLQSILWLCVNSLLSGVFHGIIVAETVEGVPMAAFPEARQWDEGVT
jgi:hypothetical protein